MFKSDDKIVSISFNNKEFLNDVSTTIKALENLNDATSGKNLKTTGLENLSSAFGDLNKSAVKNIDGINQAVSDTSAYSKLSDGVAEAGNSFNLLEGIAVGAMLSIGNAAVNFALQGVHSLTSGIRDGWQEYNLLVDSTQTILANTEKYGTTITDVTKSLDELNAYADLTIYNFSQMTRNMGYFTTSGMDLDAAQNMVQGMSNVAALFGASNESLQRAMYQTSQAISAGMFRKMDWKSLQNATMSGAILQDELIRVAALMSGRTFDDMNNWISSVGGFYESLDKGWLTSEIFQETMRRFAGMTREEVAAIRDINGNALDDKEIDRIVELGEKGLEAAQVVRTLKQMLESVGESIGSGWAETFRLIIGNLEDAKRFWSPINKLITETVGKVSDYRNTVVKAWADTYRPKMLDDMNEAFRNISEVFDAVGIGVQKAFGDPKQIGKNIGVITEALGDLAHSLKMDEDELRYISDLVEGILSPFKILGDIVTEFVTVFFNAGQSMDIFATRTDSVIDKLHPIRKAILSIVGAFGRFLTITTNIVRNTGIVQKSFNILFNTLKFAYITISRIYGAIFNVLNALWSKYDMTNKVLDFTNIVYNELLNLRAALWEVYGILKIFFTDIVNELSNMDLDPIQDFFTILSAIKTLINDILDPTISLSAAFNKFKQSLQLTTIYRAVVYIKNAVVELFNTIRNSSLGPYIDMAYFAISKLMTIAKYAIGAIILGIIKLKELIANTDLHNYLSKIGDGFTVVFNKLKGTRFGEFITNISNNISTALNNLSLIFKGNKVTNDAIEFVGDIKDALTVKGGLPEDNVINFVKGMGEQIKDTAEAVSNNRSFIPLKTAIDEIKDVSVSAFGLLNIFDTEKDTYDAADKAANVFTIMINIFKTLGSALSGVGAVIFNVVKSGLQYFSDTLSLMASGERYRDLDNAHRFADIIQMFIQVFTRISSMALLFLSALASLRWASAVKAIGEALDSIADSVNQMFKSKKWANIAKVFVAIAAIILILTAGSALIAKFVNIEKYNAVLNSVTSSIVTILAGITLLVAVVMIFGTMVSNQSKLVPLRAAATMAGMSIIFNSISKIMSKLSSFVLGIALISYAASRLGEDEFGRFKESMAMMTLMFAGIALVLTLITSLLISLSNQINPLNLLVNTMSIPGKNGGPINPIMQVLKIFKTIAGAITLVMIGMSASMSMILLSTKDISTLKVVMTGFIAIITVIMLSMLVMLEKIDLMSKTMDVTGGRAAALTIGRIAQLFKALTLGIVAASIAISLALTTMTFAIAAIGMTLNNVQSKEYLVGILAGIGVFVLALTFILGKLVATLTNPMIPQYRKIGLEMLAISAAMVIMSISFSMLIGTIAAFALLTSTLSIDRLRTIFGIVLGVFAVVEGTLIAVTALSGRFPHLNGLNMRSIATAMVIASASLLLIAGSLLAVALIPAEKLTQVAITLGALFVAISVALGVLTALTKVPGGTEAIIAVAGAMVIAGAGLSLIGTAMVKAAKSFALFTVALRSFQNLNGQKIRNNILEIGEAMPGLLKLILANIDLIKTTIVGFGSIFGTAFATAIFEGVIMFNSLIQGNAAMIISGIGSVLIGIIEGILIVLKEFMQTLIKPGSVLWDILDLLGQFLTKAANYVGYYGFLVVVEFFKGVIHAITDLGWDLYIQQGLNVIWTNVKNWWAENVSHWLEERINEVVTAVNLASNAGEIEDRQREIESINEEIARLESTYSRDQYGRLYDQTGGRSLSYGPNDSLGPWNDYLSLINQRNELQGEIGDLLNQNDDVWRTYYNVDSQIQGEINNAVNANNELATMIDNAIEAERTTRHLFDNAPSFNERMGGYTSYIPEEYKGAGMDNRIRTTTNTLADGIHNVGQALRDAIGISEGQSIGDFLFGGLFGDSFSFDNIFGNAGSSSGSSFFDGFNNALGEGLKTEDWNVDNISIGEDGKNPDLGKFSSALQESANLPDDVKHPVISPVWDDSQLKTDAQGTLDWWNGKTYDQFAIDASNSMLFREQAKGDAATDGNVSISYTQINNSPKELSPIEVYRDTKNLLRGSGKFVLS